MTYEDLRISRSIKGEGLILFTNSQKSRHGPECILTSHTNLFIEVKIKKKEE